MVLIGDQARKLNSSEQWREFLRILELHEIECFRPTSTSFNKEAQTQQQQKEIQKRLFQNMILSIWWVFDSIARNNVVKFHLQKILKR